MKSSRVEELTRRGAIEQDVDGSVDGLVVGVRLQSFCRQWDLLLNCLPPYG